MLLILLLVLLVLLTLFVVLVLLVLLTLLVLRCEQFTLDNWLSASTRNQWPITALGSCCWCQPSHRSTTRAQNH